VQYKCSTVPEDMKGIIWLHHHLRISRFYPL